MNWELENDTNAVIDGTINYTPISFNAIHSVCALPEPRKNTELFNLLYTLNEKTQGCLRQEWHNCTGINTIPAVDDASVSDCVTVAQFHLFTNRNRYSVKIDMAYVIRRSNTAATIYVGVHTVCLTL